MKIAIGNDHGGYSLKNKIKELLKSRGIEYQDFGTNSRDSVDYPEFAAQVSKAVTSGKCERGILICGTGIGMSIAANKIKGVRAALCHDLFSAKVTRQHNNSNVLALGERVLGDQLALEIVEVWLKTDFDGGRHQRRINKISQLEQ